MSKNKTYLLYTLSAVILNLIVPGAGLALLGRWWLALLTQSLLISVVVALCWSRSVFESVPIEISIGLIIFVYLMSTYFCLTFKTQYCFKAYQRGLMVIGFILVSIGGFTAAYLYKHQWLGFGIYFVPSMSMHPTLKPGQFILVDTWVYKNEQPTKGDIVVFQHRAENQWLVKRIADWPVNRKPKNESYYVLGDNAKASHDSRRFGGIKREKFVGKVKLVLFGINHKHQIVKNSYLQHIQ